MAVWLFRGEGWPPRAAWPGIAGTGVLWFGVYMVALNWGERHVDAGTAAMIINIGPVVIAVLGGWLLREGFPRRLLAGLAVSFAGAAVVAVSESGGGSASLLGVGMCLLAAVSYATAVVGQKPALRHASALQVTTFGCLAGTLATLPFAARLVSQTASAPVSATLLVVYLGVVPTALAFTTWAYALNRTTAGKMGVDHVHRARPGRADVVGVPRRDPAAAGLRRRGAVPGRCGDLARAPAGEGGTCRGGAGHREPITEGRSGDSRSRDSRPAGDESWRLRLSEPNWQGSV